MNSTLYSSAQMLYGLSRFALVSRAFSALHPKYGTPAHKPIVEPWKCPYHNGRMCMELMRRNPDVNV